MASASVPSIKPGSRIGLDIGGTKAIVAVPGEELRRYECSAYGSFDELFDTIVGYLRFTPEKVGSVMAGELVGNTLDITNIEHWPVINFMTLEQRTGVKFYAHNDMVGMHAGLALINPAELPVLKSGAPRQPNRPLVMTISTGVGDCAGEPSQAGHMGWQAISHHEVSYLSESLNREVFTVEEAISGKQGFDRMFDFVRIGTLADDVRAEIEELRLQSKPIARAVTKHAVKGDERCRSIVRLFQGILGGHIRNRAVATLATEVYLTGSVITGTPGFAELLFESELYGGREQNPLLRRLHPQGAVQGDQMKDLTVYLLDVPEIGALGALELVKD